VSEPLARLYDLALRALDDHERRADALRGRLAPVLAAAALGASLLSGPVIGGAHPTSIVGKAAIVVAVGGLLVMVAAAFHLLAVRQRSRDAIDARGLASELASRGLLADEADFYDWMIARLGEHIDRSTTAVEDLTRSFAAMLCGILVMLCGLALAALVG